MKINFPQHLAGQFKNRGVAEKRGGGRVVSSWIAILSALLAICAHGQTYNWVTLAGNTGGSGGLDGSGSVARFESPSSIAVAPDGTIYVADSFNYSVRKITTNGVVTTFAGATGKSGYVDAAGANARFGLPTGIAVDKSGNVYVSDQGYNTIRKITTNGVVSTFAGVPYSGGGQSQDGSANFARFWSPYGLAFDPSGFLYVADQYNQTIRKVATNGFVTTFAGSLGLSGSSDGTNTARFNIPTGIAVDASSNVFVADKQNSTIRKISPAGLVTTLAGSPGVTGRNDGTGANARFWQPTALTIDSSGNLFLADTVDPRIRKITPGGVVTTIAGNISSGYSDGTNTGAFFNNPRGIALGSNGSLYVADLANDCIRAVTQAGVVTTLAGAGILSGTNDGVGIAARFNQPYDLRVDSSNNVFVADAGNNSIRKITPDGTVSTFVGAGIPGSPPLNFLAGMGMDSSNNLITGDSAVIRKISPSRTTTVVASSLGQGSGWVDGSAPNARFNSPTYGLFSDAAGNIYVSDTYNYAVRKVGINGIVSTIAGGTNYVPTRGTNDGPVTTAHFGLVAGLVVDSSNNVFVVDSDNYAIRKISADGIVSTFAGAPGVAGAADGTNNTARFYYPSGMAMDSNNVMFVVDKTYGRVRRITPGGVVTTVAGGESRYSLADGIGGAAGFFHPRGIALDSAGNLYLADTLNHRIVRGVPIAIITNLSPASAVSGSGGFTLQVFGSGFLTNSTVLWNGSPRATTYLSPGQLQAVISSADNYYPGLDVTNVTVVVQNSALSLSPATGFTLTSANVNSAQTQVAGAGQSATASAPPAGGTQAGVSLTVDNSSGTQPVVLTAASYVSNPASGTTFSTGSSYVDVQVFTSLPGSAMNSYFYYPATVTGSAEEALVLLYFNGTAWVPVISAGGLPPVKSTTNDLDGIVSGGRFSVLFDNTSTPPITQLTGTPIALAVDSIRPQINLPANIITFPELGQSTALINFVVTATDNSGTATVVCSPASGSAFPLGTTTVNCIATDPSGNSTNASFTVTVLPLANIVVEHPTGQNLASGSTSPGFGLIPVGSSSAVKTFTVRNTGNGNLTNVAVNMDGANAAEFAVVASPANTIVPGGNTTFSLRFTPASAGNKSAALHLTSNDPYKNPFNLNLIGQGTTSPNPVVQTADGSFGFSNGQFAFNVSALPGSDVVIQVSSNLQTWASFQTNSSMGSEPLYFSDPQSTNAKARFYRAMLPP